MTKSRQALKDFVKAVSLANLCFIDVWTELLSKPTHLGVQYSLHIFNKHVAIIINVLLLAALFWGVVVLIRRSGNRLLLRAGRFGFVLVLFFCLNRVIHKPLPVYSVESMFGGFNYVEWAILATASVALLIAMMRRWSYAPASAACLVPFLWIGKTPLLGLAVVAAAAYLLVRKPRIVVQVSPVLAMALFPFVLMTFFQATLLLTKFYDKRPAAAVSRNNQPARRVVWLLFDEMDYRLGFPKRPADLSMPEFDRLRSQAIFASNAYPPADRTLLSMPALITGRLVSGADPVSPSELMITYADTGETVAWSAQPNLFSKAYGAGFNTAIVGWYHPYGRIIGDSLTKCSDDYIGGITIVEAMTDQLRKLGNIIPFASQTELFGIRAAEKRLERERHLRDYQNVLEKAKKAVVDPNVDLTLIHLPIPHAPSIYNRHNGQFQVSTENSYLDSLALADRTMGELRQVMESAGVWDSTTLLITSDHWWRFYESDSPADIVYAKEVDHRVPFLVKLAGHANAVTYDQAFNSVITHDLILEILGSKLSDPASVTGWLDRNRSTAEPYCRNVLQKNLSQ